MRTVLQFLRGITEAEGAEGMDPLGEGLQVRGDAGDGAVGKAPAALLIDLVSQGIEKRPRQTARPEGSLIAPLLRLHEGEEAAEIAALHRPRALGGRHLDGKVGFAASRRGSRCRPRDRGAPAGGPPPSVFRSRISRQYFPPNSFVKRFGAILELLRAWFLAYL